MNRSAIQSWLVSRATMRSLLWIATPLLLATFVAASQSGSDADRGGASPYSPTRGEWLCLVLNARQALANSERASSGVVVHYLYDKSKPDTIRIKLLYGDGISESQVHCRASRADRQATEAAETHGWQGWLKIEHEEKKVADLFISEALMR